MFHNHQPFHSPTFVQYLGVDSKVEYADTSEEMIPESHNNWVHYMQSDENDIVNSFKGQVTSFPVLYLSWTETNHSLQCLKHFQARPITLIYAKWCNKT